MSVAPAIGRYFMEIGEERILHRLHEAVTSGLTFDIGDYKESRDHKLLHLVWRKEPRTKTTSAANSSFVRSEHGKENEGTPSEGKKKKRKRTSGRQQQQQQGISFLSTELGNGLVTVDESPSESPPSPSSIENLSWTQVNKRIGNSGYKQQSEDFAPDTSNRFAPLSGESSSVTDFPAYLSQMVDCLIAEDAGETSEGRAESPTAASNHVDRSNNSRQEDFVRESPPPRLSSSFPLPMDTSVCSVAVETCPAIDKNQQQKNGGQDASVRETPPSPSLLPSIPSDEMAPNDDATGSVQSVIDEEKELRDQRNNLLKTLEDLKERKRIQESIIEEKTAQLERKTIIEEQLKKIKKKYRHK